MQRNGPISSWDQQGEANWSKEVRESELNSSSTKKKKKKKLLTGRGSGKKQKGVEVAVVFGNKK